MKIYRYTVLFCSITALLGCATTKPAPSAALAVKNTLASPAAYVPGRVKAVIVVTPS